MKRTIGLMLVGLALAWAASAPAGAALNGNWRLTSLASLGNIETTSWLLKLQTTGGKTTATLVAANPAFKKAELVSFTMAEDHVRVVVKSPAEQVFEGRVSKDGKKIVGVVSADAAANAAYMVPTELTKLEAKDVTRRLGIAPMDEWLKINNNVVLLQVKAQSSKDPAEKAKLDKQLTESARQATLLAPKLYRETIEKHKGTFAAGRAAFLLLQNRAIEATPVELKSWAQLASQSAAEFGATWAVDINRQIANGLLGRNVMDLAVEYARTAEKTLDDQCSRELQAKVLATLATALKGSSDFAELKAVTSRLEQLEKVLDDDYLAKVPPFKGQKFAGRKGQNDRVVVMELFTGAQGQACVAAEVAFDALWKNYGAKDLALIQYHLHHPGPDPLTNSDSEARAKYYGIGVTPIALFNGVVAAAGGGDMSAAEARYAAYRAIIDPLLETESACQITASAKLVGTKIEIHADVLGMKKPGQGMKLRIVLVEETIRFAGSNKLRFHHQVARAFPGGVAGVPVATANLSTKNEVDLVNLRGQLSTYLDNYAATARPFPQAGRPMDLTGLRVIAMVQDDATRAILQAVQANVEP